MSFVCIIMQVIKFKIFKFCISKCSSLCCIGFKNNWKIKLWNFLMTYIKITFAHNYIISFILGELHTLKWERPKRRFHGYTLEFMPTFIWLHFWYSVVMFITSGTTVCAIQGCERDLSTTLDLAVKKLFILRPQDYNH